MAITKRREIGNKGEEEATAYLEREGFRIITRNYLRKWGEIDIIAMNKGVLYFVEVKTVSSNFHMQGKELWYQPEQNLHKRKCLRLKRAIQSYLAEQGLSIETEWEFSAITVVLKRGTRKLYKLEHLENLII